MSPRRIAPLLVLALAAARATVPSRASTLAANPFARTNVVSLFAHLPGTVAAPTLDSGPRAYESKRFDIYGTPDPALTKTGRLADGTWILISSIGGASLVYRWSAGSAVVVGALHDELESETVSIEGGIIVERARVYAPVGPCTPGAILVRRFAIRGGTLREIGRDTDPPHFATTISAPLPDATLDDETFVQALADRTPGLYRMCDHGRTTMFYGNGTARYYRSADIDLYGRPDAEDSVRFSNGAARLIAVPFSSGGNGGVFTAAVYRIDHPHPVLVRTLRSNGHMMLRARDDVLEMFSPPPNSFGSNCCTRVSIRAFRYDPQTNGLVTIGTRWYTSVAALPRTRAYRSLTILNDAGYPFDGTDIDALFAGVLGTTVERSSDGGVFYASKRYGIFGRPDGDRTRGSVLIDGTRVLIVPFDNGSQVMIFRRSANRTIPVGSLIGPGNVNETVTVERGAIVQRYAGATVTYALRDDRLVETSHTARTRAPQ